MKQYLYILLVGMSLPLISCTIDNEAPFKQIKAREQKLLSDPKLRYMFGETLEVQVPSPFSYGESTSYGGEVSESFKHTLRTLWNHLKEKGFSGYDDSELSPGIYLWCGVRSHNGSCPYDKEINLPQTNSEFARNVINEVLVFQRYPYEYHDYVASLDYVATLIGLKYQEKALTLVKGDSDQYEIVLADEFRQDPERSFYDYIPSKIDSDIPVTQAQIDEWNQVFIDALREDSFFKQFFTEAVPEDSSSGVSLRAGRVGASGLDATALTLNGVSGNRVDLGLPVFVQLKGSVDGGKSTTATTGVVAYRLGNTVIGAIQAYANSGEGFGGDSRQLETSVVASHSFGVLFVEGQLGTVSAKEVQFKDWSGVRSQVTLGYDFDTVSPFVQLTHRDFGDSTDTAAYAGIEMDLSQLKVLDYTFNTHLLTKVGHHSMNGFSGSVEWSGSLTLNSGVSFSTNLGLDTVAGSAAKFSISVER